MNTSIPDRYQLAADFEKRAPGFSFPAEVWNVAAELAEADKPTSSLDLANLTGQNFDQVHEALGRLLAEKLVRQILFTWKEYTEEREKARIAAKNAPVADKRVDPIPAPAANQSQPGARLGTITPKPTGSSASTGWVWQKPDPAMVAASQPVIPTSLPNGEQPNGRLLRPLLEQIGNTKGGGVEGQLLVYQVFLRVPYQLLHDEGIKALHFVDERTVIQNPALHAAILKAAKEVAGIELS